MARRTLRLKQRYGKSIVATVQTDAEIDAVSDSSVCVLRSVDVWAEAEAQPANEMDSDDEEIDA